MEQRPVIKEEDRDKVAIVVVGYNRIAPLSRLLTSLQNADYKISGVPLYISIDCSGDEELYEYVDKFVWNHGNKYLNIQNERLGLRNHIIQCGDLTQFFKAIILLEDDIYVSEYFYKYVIDAIDFYGDDDKIGGISLYQHEMWNGNLPILYCQGDSDTYLWQHPASWGECWTKKQWSTFREWYDKFEDSEFQEIDMPEYMKRWNKAWSKYFMAFLIQTDRYFVFPYISLTTCFGDAGEHSNSSSMLGQTTLLAGERNFKFCNSDLLMQYDIYGVNQNIYNWIGISKQDLCVDWYGNNNNIRRCRFLLTTFKLPLTIVRTYGLFLKPIDLNVKLKIKGEGIYLYDCEENIIKTADLKLPLSNIKYYLKAFNINYLTKYVLKYYYTRILYKFRLTNQKF